MSLIWKKQELSSRQKLASLVVIAVLLIGVGLFFGYIEKLKSFKLYYLKSYVYGWGFRESDNNRQTITVKSMPVLLYHSIVAKEDGDNVSLDNFIAQMEKLHQAGYYTISVSDLDEFMDGKKDLSGKPFVLTFDDGIKDSYYPVDPILKTLNYQAAMFAISRFAVLTADHAYYLPLRKLKQMQITGRWEVFSHGRDDHVLYTYDEQGNQHHFLSNKLWLEQEGRLETDEEFIQRISDDLRLSRQDLEDGLGTTVQYYAYPFGDYGQDSLNYDQAEKIIDQVVHQIYDRSFYQVWEDSEPSQNFPEYNMPRLKRLSVLPDWSAEDLLTFIEQGTAKTLPYVDNFSTNTGWRQTWSRLEINDGKMYLTTGQDATGGASFLDGTMHWQDYSVKAGLDWQQGQSVSLMLRFRDTTHYVACTYSGKSVLIEERFNDQSTTAVRQLIDGEFDRSNLQAGARVKNRQVECLLNGDVVVTKLIESIPQTGGIGIKMWDPVEHNAQVSVRQIEVEQL